MRTCLVGQSRLFRAGLSLVLRDTPFGACREAERLDDVLPDLQEHELILVQKPTDIRAILDSLKALKADEREPRVILIAVTVELDQLVAAFSVGVDGFLLEETSADALLASLHLVSLSEKVFPGKLASLLCEVDLGSATRTATSSNGAIFSSREHEIVKMLANGAPNKVIAHRLQISEATVKVHVKTILKKIGATNRTQAAIWAVQKGLVLDTAQVVLSFPPHGRIMPTDARLSN